MPDTFLGREAARDRRKTTDEPEADRPVGRHAGSDGRGRREKDEERKKSGRQQRNRERTRDVHTRKSKLGNRRVKQKKKRGQDSQSRELCKAASW